MYLHVRTSPFSCGSVLGRILESCEEKLVPLKTSCPHYNGGPVSIRHEMSDTSGVFLCMKAGKLSPTKSLCHRPGVKRGEKAAPRFSKRSGLRSSFSLQGKAPLSLSSLPLRRFQLHSDGSRTVASSENV